MDVEELAESRLSVRNFVAARAQEIITLSRNLANKGREGAVKGFAFQHVPKHMRRRAVSHNPKRLPSRLQIVHLNQVDKSSGGVKKKGKVPSRKHRRRKSNLLLEYNRRQREIKWIETHIWHAKRFHMEARWGYKIPMCPCDKGYRSLYRAFSTSVTMQDRSFYQPIQLTISNPNEFCNNFINHLSPNEANSVPFFCQTTKESTLNFYKEKAYPFGFVGIVRYFWQKVKNTNYLIFYLHPAYKDQVIEELRNVFELRDIAFNEIQISEISNVEIDQKEKSIDEVKFEAKKDIVRRCYENDNRTVKLNELDGLLNRLRFYGPKAAHIFQQVLKPIENENEENKRIFSNVQDIMENFVLPLTVRDPRVFLPEKREWESLKNEKSSDKMEINYQINYDQVNLNSSIFNEGILSNIVKEKMSEAEFCKRRSQLLIPGSQIELQEEENKIPIILIKSSDFYDLIIPCSWTMPFWISFSYRSIRASGLRDSRHFAFEHGNIFSEEFFAPDSSTGLKELKDEGSALEETHFRLPPAKRPNLVKLSTVFPFHPNFQTLLSFLNSNLGSDFFKDSKCPKPCAFFVLRNASLIRKLNSIQNAPFEDNLKEIKTFLGNSNLLDAFESCLIGIKIEIAGRGNPNKFSVISIPQLSTDITQGFDEPPRTDETQKEREELKKKHTKFMAYLRKKRKKYRKKNREADEEEKAENLKKILTYDSSTISEVFNSKMNSLWVPSTSKISTSPINNGEILQDCPEAVEAAELRKLPRIPIGFVTSGGEAYKIGKCQGLGYVSLYGFLKLKSKLSELNLSDNIVLIRNWNESLIHRSAILRLCEIN